MVTAPKPKRRAATKKQEKKPKPSECQAADLFMRSLQTGASVQGAAEAAGKPRTTFYSWRARYPDFAAKWDAAVEAGTDRLEDEAVLRATSGVAKPIFYGGKLVGYEKRHSDTLLMFLLKGRRPERFDPGNAKGAQASTSQSDSDLFLERIANLLGIDQDSEKKNMPQGSDKRRIQALPKRRKNTATRKEQPRDN